jgi:hypothetical protein
MQTHEIPNWVFVLAALVAVPVGLALAAWVMKSRGRWK